MALRLNARVFYDCKVYLLSCLFQYIDVTVTCIRFTLPNNLGVARFVTF